MSPTVDNSLTPPPSIAMTTASSPPSPAPRDLSSYQFQLGAAFRAVIVQPWGEDARGRDVFLNSLSPHFSLPQETDPELM